MPVSDSQKHNTNILKLFVLLMNPQVFRESDIRGVVEEDFDDEFYRSGPRITPTMLQRAGKRTITVGRDCRLSSDRLFHLLLEGLLPSGINAVDIGVVPTPLLYFSVLQWNMDGGVMITGSHNAAEYNGFKLGIGPSTIFGADIQKAAGSWSSASLSATADAVA